MSRPAFGLLFQKSSAKVNAWLGAPVTLGRLGSDSVKKEEVFIKKMYVKQSCEKWGFVSNFYMPNAQF